MKRFIRIFSIISRAYREILPEKMKAMSFARAAKALRQAQGINLESSYFLNAPGEATRPTSFAKRSRLVVGRVASPGVVSAILFVLFISSFLTLSAAEETQKPVVKIGFIAPLTGKVAALGQDTKDAILLAQSELLPSDKFNYQIIFEDDQLDNKLTALAAQKLIHIDKVDAIITFSAGPGNVVAPLAKQNKILHFNISFDGKLADGGLNFVDSTPPRAMANLFMQVLKKKGINKIAFAELNQQGVYAVAEELAQQLKQDNTITLTAREKFNFGDRDFRTLIAKLKETQPQAYFIMSFSPELEILAQQMKQAAIKDPITTIWSYDTSDNPKIFDGQWYVSTAEPLDSFKDKFEKRYGRRPEGDQFNSYDIFNMIVKGFETSDGSQKPTAPEVAAQLHQLKDFEGSVGHLEIDSQGVVQSQPTYKEMVNGKPIVKQI